MNLVVAIKLAIVVDVVVVQHALTPWWVWVVTVAVARSDTTIHIVNDMLSFLVDSSLSTSCLCRRFGGIDFRYLRRAGTFITPAARAMDCVDLIRCRACHKADLLTCTYRALLIR